jgi:hypothetical protein
LSSPFITPERDGDFSQFNHFFADTYPYLATAFLLTPKKSTPILASLFQSNSSSSALHLRDDKLCKIIALTIQGIANSISL